MKIDRMTENQLEAVAQLEKRCFSHPWSFNSLEEELNNETSLFFTATEDNAVVGYIGMSVIVDEGYIFNVAVDGTHRNRGIGSALVETLVTYAKKNNLCFLTLEVRESNGNARSLYEKFGFIKVGERKNYYSSPTAAAVSSQDDSIASIFIIFLSLRNIYDEVP